MRCFVDPSLDEAGSNRAQLQILREGLYEVGMVFTVDSALEEVTAKVCVKGGKGTDLLSHCSRGPAVKQSPK